MPQHILRYWETRFPQLRPMQRAGNRRYYRPGDVELARRIHRLLNQEGYTVRGVQQLLERDAATIAAPPPAVAAASGAADAANTLVEDLQAIRDALALALIDDTRVTM